MNAQLQAALDPHREVGVEQAHDDAQVGPHGACVERCREVDEIVVGRGDERARGPDPELAQDLRLASVARDDRDGEAPGGADEAAVLVGLDRDDAHLALDETERDPIADRAEAAHDDVVPDARAGSDAARAGAAAASR